MALKKDRITNLAHANRSDYSLYALCQRYHIDFESTHNALEDAYLTGMLYLHMNEGG